MKWNNVGHQFDKFYEEWNEQGEYYIWGAALVGQSFLKKFNDKLNIVGYIDSDITKQGKQIGKYIIHTPDVLKGEKKRVKVIIASYFYREILTQLEEMGYVENVDACDSRMFTEIFYMYKYHKLFLHRTDISITTKCSLNCAKCNMWTPYYKDAQHKSFDVLKADFAAYFQWVDNVSRLYLLGGEALLHPELNDIVLYLMKNYKDKIERLEIFTNATIIPSDELLGICKEYHIAFFVSDYTPNNTGLVKRFNDVISKLNKYEIEYVIDRYDTWLDFGDPLVTNKQDNEHELSDFFDRCHMIWRGLQDKKYYFCHSDCSAKRAGIIDDNINDYFDLNNYSEKRKIELLEFDLGYNQRGYLELCNRCNGSYGLNNTYTEVAIQKQKN